MRKTVKILLAIVAVVVIQEAFLVWAWRTRNPRALRLAKRFVKLGNPLYLRFSGRSGSHLATVHHVGRRSRTPYATPVMAHRAGEDIIIPLPYGTDVDWLRNLVAAGEGVVDIDGRSLTATEPQVVDVNDVIALLPTSMVRTVRFNGAREVVRLRVSPVANKASA